MTVAHGGAPWLGVLQLEVGTPWARSLKEKRALLLPLLTRWRARPELSVARLAGLDDHDRETWALAAVDADADRLRAVLERARDEVVAHGLTVRAARLDLEAWDPLDPRDGVPELPGAGATTR
ncbi:MAG: DUF503 family protein [Trueperaceae bacterium]|nr:DUF503 family protein [Trueperaceae bacterium]